MHIVVGILQPKNTKSAQANIDEPMSTVTPKQLFAETY